jgi:hypothetical protein
MYHHMNAKNGEPAPLLADDVYEIIMEVSPSCCPGRPGAWLLERAAMAVTLRSRQPRAAAMHPARWRDPWRPPIDRSTPRGSTARSSTTGTSTTTTSASRCAAGPRRRRRGAQGAAWARASAAPRLPRPPAATRAL